MARFAAMDSGFDSADFDGLVQRLLRRFLAQHAAPPPPDAELRALAARLRQLIVQRGLPPPLHAGERGAPREMPDRETGPLVAVVAGEGANPLLADAVRQLVKACFYPEFTECRDSYKARSPDGSCRRQQLERARGRVSGSHCVDCPYWLSLEPDDHAALLEESWCGEREEFRRNRGVFLPEDFRALRRAVRAEARVRS